ncbi:MAG TPA: hypothetical protein VMB03_12340 [Bryobacteraceae bacterium]|nr:hypothetical protein [Bryobacteraceae bacterium]
MTRWSKLLLLLVAGYLTLTRSFAHFGIPAANLFVGEIAIGAFLLFRSHEVLENWLASLRQPTRLSGFSLAFACFLAYGLFELIRGFGKGNAVLLTLQDFAFSYYPICFFIGLWLGSADPRLLRKVIRFVAWSNGIYGILFIVVLNRFLVAVPGTTDVPLFGQPAGSSIVILGLICLEPKLSRVWHLLLMNLLVMLGLQVRAEFLGFILGVALWGLLARRFDRIFAGMAVLAALLIAGLLTDFRMPAPGTRGGEISSRDIIGRVVAPADPELAAEYTENARSDAGTATWRLVWWQKIWDDVHRDTATALFGEAYGFPLADLVGYRERDLRTPHSVFFYALGYGGWVGVLVFFTLQFSLGRTLWAAWRRSGLTFGPVVWITFLSGAFFGNAFETPFGAVPFYLLTGLAAAPLCLQIRKQHAYPAGTYVLQTAWR